MVFQSLPHGFGPDGCHFSAAALVINDNLAQHFPVLPTQRRLYISRWRGRGRWRFNRRGRHWLRHCFRSSRLDWRGSRRRLHRHGYRNRGRWHHQFWQGAFNFVSQRFLRRGLALAIRIDRDDQRHANAEDEDNAQRTDQLVTGAAAVDRGQSVVFVQRFAFTPAMPIAG